MGAQCYVIVMENQRDVSLVEYNIRRNLLLSNSRLLGIITAVTEIAVIMSCVLVMKLEQPC